MATNLFQAAETAWIYGVMTFAPALFAGLWLGSITWRPTGAVVFAIGGVVFVGLQAISLYFPTTFLIAQLLGVLLSLAFMTMVSVLCAGLGKTTLIIPAFLGVASMGIYLAHPIFSAAIGALLAPFSSNLTAHMLAATLAGIIGPLAIYHVIRKVGRPSWIGF